VAVGAEVTSLAVGDEVFAMMPQDYGAQAELVALPAELVAKKPAKLTMVEAASVPATATTALHALRDHGKVGPGTAVLINGASGGVGIFAVQLAKDLGAHVTAVCGAANAALVRDLGADEVIDYKTTDFTKGAQTFDVILDAVGNAPYHACKAVLRGRWVHITLQPRPRIFVRSFVNRFTKGKVVPMLVKPSADRIEYIRARLEAGTLRTVVDRVLPASAVADAQAHSKSGRAKGKIVLTF
jgi:NADPH:quinone reductase-like Zn-dependent oxidoreductase